MTRTANTFGIVLLGYAAFAFAEAAPEPSLDSTFDRDVQIARTLTEASRQATVAENVTLTEAQAAVFWPIYREYRLEVAKQNDRLAELIRTYASKYPTMTDADAKKLTETYLDIDRKRLDLKVRYVKKFEKALPAALVARAMQTEQKLDAMQAFTIARTVPLVPAAASLTASAMDRPSTSDDPHPRIQTGRSCSATVRVLSIVTSPVCSVDLRSISITWHSSSATGLWRTPLGTMNISPSCRSTLRSSSSMRSRPLSTKNNSSSSAWLCHVNVPWSLGDFDVRVIDLADDAGRPQFGERRGDALG